MAISDVSGLVLNFVGADGLNLSLREEYLRWLGSSCIDFSPVTIASDNKPKQTNTNLH